jgi:hypothetical protein
MLNEHFTVHQTCHRNIYNSYHKSLIAVSKLMKQTKFQNPKIVENDLENYQNSPKPSCRIRHMTLAH